jgi:hypothetical protein
VPGQHGRWQRANWRSWTSRSSASRLPEITEAVKLAQESHTAWQDALCAHFEAVQHDALHKLAGNGDQIAGGHDMLAHFERQDTAAAAAHEADAALITALTAETVVAI